jgi:membrane protease YdiL (CAAX protease family)
MNAIAVRPLDVQRRLALSLWLAGMVGVVVLTWQFLPVMLAQQAPNVPLPMPIEWLMLIGAAQSGALLALAVWTGLSLAAPVGLRAPVFEAWAGRGDVAGAARPLLVPGVLGGLAGGAWLLLLARWQPADLAGLSENLLPPIAARLLYGGVTEELLTRWGLMSAALWALARWCGRIGRPTAVLLAIVATAVLFGLLHLPAAFAMLGTLTLPVVGFVVFGNTVAGSLFGWLYWRHGLEAAMLAHAGAHLTVWLALA